MLKPGLAVMFLLGILCGRIAVADEKNADPRERPETALAEMVRVMESNDVAAYFEKFASQREINLATQNGKVPLADAVKEIARRMQKDPERTAQAAADLRKALAAKPVLSAGGKEATFVAPRPAPYASITVVLEQDGKFWRAKKIDVVPKSSGKAKFKGKITVEPVEKSPGGKK